MKKILQLFRNVRDFILIFVVLCIAHFEGEEEEQEITPENETR